MSVGLRPAFECNERHNDSGQNGRDKIDAVIVQDTVAANVLHAWPWMLNDFTLFRLT